MSEPPVITIHTAEKEPPPAEPWMERFLALLSETGNVTYAAAGAGVSRFTVYKYRHASADFAARWEAARELGIDGLEDVARERARTMSDTLLIFMLKAARPEKYRERIETRTVTLTPEQAAQMTTDELEAELKRRGVL